MKNKINGHLLSRGWLDYIWHYEDWDYYVREKFERRIKCIQQIPSNSECHELCKKLSGEVKVYYIDKI